MSGHHRPKFNSPERKWVEPDYARGRAEYNYTDICGICRTPWNKHGGWVQSGPNTLKCGGCGGDWGITQRYMVSLRKS